MSLDREDNLSYILSKSRIIGRITEETPIVVIEEYLLTLGVNVDVDRLKEINYRARSIMVDVEPIVVTKEFSTKDLRAIALYVNPDRSIKWTVDKLMKVFQWVYTGSTEVPDAEYIKSCNIAYPNMFRINNVPPSFLYSWCKRLGGTTRSNMGIEEMRCYCINLMLDKDELLIKLKSLALSRSFITLAMITSNLESTEESIKWEERKKVNYNSITKSIEEVKSGMLNVSSYSDSIVLAATQFHIDITTASNPIIEYYNLVERRPFSDDRMRKMVAINPYIFSMTHYFNPSIPIDLYTSNDISELSKKMNCNGPSKQSSYQALACLIIVENFYYGIMPNLTSLETSIECVDLVDYKGDIICYGSFYGKMNAYTVNELSLLLENNRSYQNPEGGVFSRDSITTLSNICDSMIRTSILSRGPRSSKYNHWERLQNNIRSTNKMLSSVDFILSSFSAKYNSLLEKDRFLVSDCLTSIYKAGMFMRGWKGGNDPLPVTIAINNDTEGTDVRCGEALGLYKATLDKLKDRSIITSLPLMIYKEDGYRCSNNKDSGITVDDRINIVLKGDKTNNMNSCIRMSSNWLVTSAYKYLESINMKPNFDITKLKHIS